MVSVWHQSTARAIRKHRIRLLSYRSHGTLMSYTDHSLQRRLKSNVPICSFGCCPWCYLVFCSLGCCPGCCPWCYLVVCSLGCCPGCYLVICSLGCCQGCYLVRLHVVLYRSIDEGHRLQLGVESGDVKAGTFCSHEWRSHSVCIFYHRLSKLNIIFVKYTDVLEMFPWATETAQSVQE